MVLLTLALKYTKDAKVVVDVDDYFASFGFKTDSVHSPAHSDTRSIELCHTAAVSGTMKLVFHIFSRSKFSMEH